MKKVRWGILSTAKIASEKVIPAMQQADLCEVSAIASGSSEKVNLIAQNLQIPKVYNSYEDLLNDKDIDAVYIPLPNDMHVPWSIKALEHNKHVLCEKPVSLNSNEAQHLSDYSKKYPHLKIMEAFMYKFHPQWLKAKELVDKGTIGQIRTIQAFFSYFNDDPGNIRNKVESGGGGLMDIGCYCISQSRFIFGREPLRIHGLVDYDPKLKTDRMASGTLDFGEGTATFTCSTQINPFQRFHIFGTKGSIEIIIPVNAPPTELTRILIHSKNEQEELTFEPINQYTLQANEFSRSILENSAVPFNLNDAVQNMKIIEAVFESSKSGKWINLI